MKSSQCLFPSYHCWSLRLRPIAFAFATAFIDFTVPSWSDTSICLRQSCKKLSRRRRRGGTAPGQPKSGPRPLPALAAPANGRCFSRCADRLEARTQELADTKRANPPRRSPCSSADRPAEARPAVGVRPLVRAHADRARLSRRSRFDDLRRVVAGRGPALAEVQHVDREVAHAGDGVLVDALGALLGDELGLGPALLIGGMRMEPAAAKRLRHDFAELPIKVRLPVLGGKVNNTAFVEHIETVFLQLWIQQL